MLIVDAHQDLTWNILTFGRDYTLSSEHIRQVEAGSLIPAYNGDSLLGWDDFQRGKVAVIFATLFVSPMRYCQGGWDTQCYTDAFHARHLARKQLEAYQRLTNEHPEKFRLIHTQSDLQEVLSCWQALESQGGKGEAHSCAVGLVLLMEGAECVRKPGELEEWYSLGVRVIGPAWAGTRFCGGTKEPGGLTSEGFALLDEMASLDFILDLSHMDEAAALQALDFFPGLLIASHSNVQSLLRDSSSNRHLSDRLIRGILERDGVIGIVPYNSFLRSGWKIGDRREEVTLRDVVAHIDYVCQMAGDAFHVGIGSDFDGGFGVQSVPMEVDTIADLQKLNALLADMGYSTTDIAAILGENWLSCLRRKLPNST